MRPGFRGGANIALKVPPHQFDATVGFYREVLGLEEIDTGGESVSFRFGAARLWIDRVAHLAKAEIWLEVATDDADTAARYLADSDVTRRDEVEALPPGMRGFWVCDAASNIILIHEDKK